MIFAGEIHANAGDGLEPFAGRILAVLHKKALLDRDNLLVTGRELRNNC
jgi:hypothetical protein